MGLGRQKPLQASTLLNHYLLSPASYLATKQQANLGSSPVFAPCPPLKSLPTVWDETLLQNVKVFLGWDKNRLPAAGKRIWVCIGAQCCSTAEGASALQLSTFALENSISSSRANTAKRQVFQTAQADRTVPRVPGWRTLPLQQSVRALARSFPSPAAPAAVGTLDMQGRSGLSPSGAARLGSTGIQYLQRDPFPPVKGSVAHRRILEDTEGRITPVPPCSAQHQHPRGHPPTPLCPAPWGRGSPWWAQLPSPHAPQL